MPELEPYPWTPGRVDLQADGGQPTLCLVYDGNGVYQGMFRVGKTKLEFANAESTQGAKRHREWSDATPLWPRFPPWLRRQVTDALHLHAAF